MLAWQGCPCLSLLPSLQLFTSDTSTCTTFTASLCFHVKEAAVPTGKTADGNVEHPPGLAVLDGLEASKGPNPLPAMV